MLSSINRSVKATFFLIIILCGLYPLLVSVVGGTFFSKKAKGQLIYQNGQPIGSKLIGQSFSRPDYFHGRPSAAGEKGYDAIASGGSNLGPLSPKLLERVKRDVQKILNENPNISKGQVPVDLITASGSGLDPHISPEAAAIQVDRVSRARGFSPNQVRELVEKHTEGPQFGLLGEAGVNVLELNLALDELRAH